MIGIHSLLSRSCTKAVGEDDEVGEILRLHTEETGKHLFCFFPETICVSSRCTHPAVSSKSIARDLPGTRFVETCGNWISQTGSLLSVTLARYLIWSIPHVDSSVQAFSERGGLVNHEHQVAMLIFFSARATWSWGHSERQATRVKICREQKGKQKGNRMGKWRKCSEENAWEVRLRMRKRQVATFRLQI